MMLTRAVKYLLIFLLVVPVRLEANELQPLLAELKQAAVATETLVSSFVQEKRLAIFAEMLLSEGRFVYRRPDSLRWELLSPVGSGFVLQGDQGERWNALSREQNSFSVASDPVMGMIARQLLAWARVDLDWLQQRYRMELRSSGPVVLQLIPRDPAEAEFIDHLQIQFAADRSHVAEVLLVEREGDSTLLRFDNAVINGELPDDAFVVPRF